MSKVPMCSRRTAALCLGIVIWAGFALRAEPPGPVLDSVFPAGGRAGTSVDVTVQGSALDGVADLRFSDDRISSHKGEGSQFTVAIPATVPPGVYDTRVVAVNGMSSPRYFVVSRRAEQVEAQLNDRPDSAEQVRLDGVVNGRIEKPGDVDCFRFTAAAGQRVVLTCWAERIDSLLRGVLEIHDAQGTCLAANRGYAGVDPLVDFLVPADGAYIVKLFDLTYAGGAAHFYRLDIDTGPRVSFTVPCVIQRGQTTRVAFYGRNLIPRGPDEHAKGSLATDEFGGSATPLDRVELEIAPPTGEPSCVGVRMLPSELAVDAFSYHYEGSNSPVPISLTDVPVVLDAPDNHAPGSPQDIDFPCEVSGQLAAGDERDWFAVQVRRGEVLWLEAFGERIGSPVDLDVAMLNPTGEVELAHWTDALDNPGGSRFPMHHLDPVGRWVAPADGRYLILVRNLTGGLSSDPRRVYRLSIRREEPDFDLAVVSRRGDQPSGLNVGRGGREMLEVLAVRHRGLTGAIRVTAENLPAGIECPDIWIGPGADRAPLVLTAARELPSFAGTLTLVGRADIGGAEVVRRVRGGSMVWAGQPTRSARLTDDISFAVAPDAPLFLTAAPSDGLIYQDNVFNLAVEVERRVEGHTAVVNLSAVGLPGLVGSAVGVIPAGENKGWLSFYLPASVPAGPFTFAVRADTEVPVSTGPANSNKGGLAVVSIGNPVTIRVAEARIALALDPRAPTRIARGKTIQLAFSAERKNGFIGKIHTQLAAPGGIVGLRARGVTLVGQTDSGSLQVIANEDAPLGRQPFLRLEAVGTVEDQPVYHASRYVDLEITE